MDIIAFIIILAAAAGLQSWLFNRFAHSRLEYSCSFSKSEAHEGEDIQLVEIVHNRKVLPLPWLKVDIHSSRWLDFAGTKSVISQENRRVTSSYLLKGFQKITRRWKLRCLKRGVFRIENVTLVWGDLLGIGSGSVPVFVNACLTVYPALVDIDNIFIPVNYLQGDTIVKRWIIDDPFVVAGAREYTPGDSMNRIHWSATARTGSMMVRKNDFTSQLSLTILLNIQSIEFEYSGVVYRERIELGIRTAATLLDRSLRMGMPARLGTNANIPEDGQSMIFTGQASGREHTGELLKILAKLELRNVKDFEIYLNEHLEEISSNEVVIITSYISSGIAETARKLVKQGNIVRLIVLDHLIPDANLPGDIDVFVLAGNEVKNEGNT